MMIDVRKTLLLLVIVLMVVMVSGCVSGEKENVTVEMNGILFDAPVTNNNTTSFTKLDDGSINWAYEDYENNVSVYVDENMPLDYSTQEQWDELSGYNQMRPVGDKWVIVCADNADDKDMCFTSARAKE